MSGAGKGEGWGEGWRFAGSCADGQRFEIVPGLDVWGQSWRSLRRAPPAPPSGNAFTDMMRHYETARVADPAHGSEHEFQVYEIDGPEGPLRFAAGEFSNTIFGFYLPSGS